MSSLRYMSGIRRYEEEHLLSRGIHHLLEEIFYIMLDSFGVHRSKYGLDCLGLCQTIKLSITVDTSELKNEGETKLRVVFDGCLNIGGLKDTR